MEEFEKVKGENPMFEELQKLMKPHTDKIVKEAVQEAVKEAVQVAVQEKAVSGIEGMITKLGISLEDACDAMGMTVEEFKSAKENRKKKEEDSVKDEDEKENTAD